MPRGRSQTHEVYGFIYRQRLQGSLCRQKAGQRSPEAGGGSEDQPQMCMWSFPGKGNAGDWMVAMAVPLRTLGVTMSVNHSLLMVSVMVYKLCFNKALIKISVGSGIISFL